MRAMSRVSSSPLPDILCLSSAALPVLGKNASRAFPYIFNRAQAMLRNTFNYELVEVRSKGADREALLSQAAAEAKGSATQRNGDGEGAKKDKSAASEFEDSKQCALEDRDGGMPLRRLVHVCPRAVAWLYARLSRSPD